MLGKFEIVEFTPVPIQDLNLGYPNPERGNILEAKPLFRNLPFVIGEGIVTLEQYQIMVEALKAAHYDGGAVIDLYIDPNHLSVKLHPALIEILPQLLPVISIETAYRSTDLELHRSISRNPLPWHTDRGDHHRRYIISAVESETTQFITGRNFYFDETGNPLDLSYYNGLNPHRADPNPKPKEIWRAPSLCWIGFYGDTLHRRPDVSEQRDYIGLVHGW